jgi:hypothetical protein
MVYKREKMVLDLKVQPATETHAEQRVATKILRCNHLMLEEVSI